MSRRRIVFATAVLASLVLHGASLQSDQLPAPASALAPLVNGNYRVAAPGRIEPASEEIRIGTSLNAVIRELLVKEGDAVKRDQVVAVLENADLKAALARAEAQLRLREAELERVNNGARPQERSEALAALQESEAVMRNAATDLERRRRLLQSNNVAQEQVDRAEREYLVAQKRHAGMMQRYSLVMDGARAEDVAIAQANVELARAARDEAKATLEKTFIRSPIDGTVLKVHRRAGELVSVFFDQPIVTLGDLTRLYARIDVDESDIAHVKLGEKAFVTANAFGDRRFEGKVARIGQTIGRKNVHTDDPKERQDTKVLEVLIALAPGAPLPTGLRINAFIMPDDV
jgi:ABC exporter DevB family membrane fusion protein